MSPIFKMTNNSLELWDWYQFQSYDYVSGSKHFYFQDWIYNLILLKWLLAIGIYYTIKYTYKWILVTAVTVLNQFKFSSKPILVWCFKANYLNCCKVSSLLYVISCHFFACCSTFNVSKNRESNIGPDLVIEKLL
jgi:hypothetical protein